MFLGTASENFPQSLPPRKKSGTFPSVFGDCFRKFPPKSAYPKQIRERSRVFLGTASENFPQSLPPRKKSGNVNPECFWGLLPNISPKVSLPEKKTRERSRVFLGTASENFPQSLPPRKKFGNVPECFGDCFRKFPPKSAYAKEIRERSRVFLGTASEDFSQSQPPRKKFGNVPDPIPYVSYTELLNNQCQRQNGPKPLYHSLTQSPE